MWCPAEPETGSVLQPSLGPYNFLRSSSEPTAHSASAQPVDTAWPCSWTGIPGTPDLSCLVWDSVLSSFVSAPVQSLSGLKVTDCSETVWISLWGSLHQQDFLGGSDKQILLPWTCQSLIPELQRWNAISHFHYLPICWIFMTFYVWKQEAEKLQFLMASEFRLCFSPYAESLKHRERHSLLCFEPCIRQLMTKRQYFSWTDRLKLHLKGLKCFQECFGNLEKNNIYLPKVFHSPWLYLIHFSFWSKLIIQESLTRKFPNHYSEKLHVDWIPVKVHFFQKRN